MYIYKVYRDKTSQCPPFNSKMGRKELKKSKTYGFQRGNVPHNKGKTQATVSTPLPVPINRLPQDVFDSRVKTDSTGRMAISNAEGLPSQMKLLRPRPTKAAIDSCIDSKVQHPDSYTYKLYRPVDVEKLWNLAINQHKNCTGYLRFDSKNSRQWGWGWNEQLYCEKCGYVSKSCQLYEDEKTDNTPRRGRRRSQLNLGMQTALLAASVSNSAMIEICLTANIIPPSYTGLQKTANHVGEKIVSMNKASMESLREKIVTDSTDCGLENPDVINAEMVGRYNNPLFSGDRTPYQGATQVTMALCEQVTSGKKILSVFTGNKLCKRAEYLRRCGTEVTCPDHTGNCTANVAEDAAIGNEEAWATIVGEDIADTVKVNYLTTDGDSKIHTGFKKSHQACRNLKDPRHLVKAVKREFSKTTFSADLFQKFQGLPYGMLKARLATDVRNRCVAELQRAHIVHRGNLDQIKQNMPMAIGAMIQCYNGNCGQMCAEYSYCCQGLPDNHWKKTFLPHGATVYLSAKDEHLFKQCVLRYLSTECLDSTKLLTNTQKS